MHWILKYLKVKLLKLNWRWHFQFLVPPFYNTAHWHSRVIKPELSWPFKNSQFCSLTTVERYQEKSNYTVDVASM